MLNKIAPIRLEADVVILGAGGAGLAAAVSASEAGAEVVVLEKMGVMGGTTRWAVGSISGARTRLQKSQGIVDSVDDFQEDMNLFTSDLLPKDNIVLRGLLAREAGATIDWLEDMGIVFAGPYPEKPNRVSRMHNTIPGALSILKTLKSRALKGGVKFIYSAITQRLLIDQEGRVIGVAYTQDGNLYELRACKGIILATGDFSGSEILRQTYLSEAAAKSIPICLQNTGDGHLMAKDIGADLCNMDIVFGPQMRFPRAPNKSILEGMPNWPLLARLARWMLNYLPSFALKPLVAPLMVSNMSPSEKLFQHGALLIDGDGNLLSHANPAISIAMSSTKRAYMLFSDSTAKLFNSFPNYVSTAPGIAYAYINDYLKARPDIASQYQDLSELAQALKIKEDKLRSIEGINTQNIYVLGPIYPMLTTTEGGLAVDTQCRVLDTEQKPIRGLYAAGCAGQGGLLLRGHGLHLAWVFTSGRIAGLHAAQS